MGFGVLSTKEITIMSAFKWLVLIPTLLLVASSAGAVEQFNIDLKCQNIPDCISTFILMIVTNLIIPVAVVTIFIAGFMFVFAGGSEQKVTTARKTLMWAILGLVIAVGAWALAAAFKNFFENIGH